MIASFNQFGAGTRSQRSQLGQQRFALWRLVVREQVEFHPAARRPLDGEETLDAVVPQQIQQLVLLIEAHMAVVFLISRPGCRAFLAGRKLTLS